MWMNQNYTYFSSSQQKVSFSVCRRRTVIRCRVPWDEPVWGWPLYGRVRRGCSLPRETQLPGLQCSRSPGQLSLAHPVSRFSFSIASSLKPFKAPQGELFSPCLREQPASCRRSLSLSYSPLASHSTVIDNIGSNWVVLLQKEERKKALSGK